MTRKDGSGVYAHNETWTSLLDTQLYRDKLDERLRQFSLAIDSIIEEVKSQWIQVKAASNGFHGLFDYDLTPEDCALDYVKFGAIHLLDDFIVASFEELWRETRQHLSLIRQELSTTLSRRCVDELTSLQRDIERWFPYPRPSALLNAIARCRTEIQNTIEVIVRWFNLTDDQELEDVSLTHVLDTVTEIVRDCYPSSQLSVKSDASPIDLGNKRLLKGEHFTRFVDLFFILFENAVLHGGVTPTEVAIGLVEAGGRFCITVHNKLAASCDVSAVDEEISRINETMASGSQHQLMGVNREGRSGFIKLKVIVGRHLKRSDCSIVCRLENGCFTVSMLMESEGLFI